MTPILCLLMNSVGPQHQEAAPEETAGIQPNSVGPQWQEVKPAVVVLLVRIL